MVDLLIGQCTKSPEKTNVQSRLVGDIQHRIILQHPSPYQLFHPPYCEAVGWATDQPSTKLWFCKAPLHALRYASYKIIDIKFFSMSSYSLRIPVVGGTGFD